VLQHARRGGLVRLRLRGLHQSRYSRFKGWRPALARCALANSSIVLMRSVRSMARPGFALGAQGDGDPGDAEQQSEDPHEETVGVSDDHDGCPTQLQGVPDGTCG
jgi:hypothetical protein